MAAYISAALHQEQAMSEAQLQPLSEILTEKQKASLWINSISIKVSFKTFIVFTEKA